ncbi:hypothetical protein [Nocardioides sp.]|uniref:hypothetical protein n=1 Tax=Nocardioides sp. TaxID=35761 RepID=UPI002C9D9438|nr:hypothetical protein [Nocardioides sp.]HXH81105.1 hypothetical protein [Nocardioides sp.]
MTSNEIDPEELAMEETLAELHRAGLVERLVERRAGRFIYVTPEHVDGRPIVPRPRPVRRP